MHIINPKSDLTPKVAIKCGAKSGAGHSRIPAKQASRRSQRGVTECNCHAVMLGLFSL